MIRKILLIMLTMLGICISAYAASTEYVQNIPVSFTFDVIANYGFTSRKVLNYIKPDGIDDVYFKLDRRNSTLRSSSFWVYYQIFTPKPVTLTMHVGNFNSKNKSDDVSGINFRSEDVYTIGGESSVRFENGKDYTLLDKKQSNSPYFDSFNIMFVIDDLSNIDWDDEYTAVLKLTLTMED